MPYQIRLPAQGEGRQAEAFRHLTGEVNYALNDLERRLAAAGTPAAGAVTGEKLAPSAVTAEKLAPSAVTAETLAPGSVTAEALAPGSVTAEKLAPGSVTAEKLAPGVVRCNPNLLDNWYFKNPVNQRGITGTFSTLYAHFIDRWFLNSAGSITIGDSGIFMGAAIMQKLEFPVPGTKTISCLYSDGTMGTGAYSDYTDGNGVARAKVSFPASNKTIVAVKLELGPTQTLCHQEGDIWVLNEIPDYGQQLRRCRRFFLRLGGVNTAFHGFGGIASSANKSVLITIQVSMRGKPDVSKNGTVRCFSNVGTAYEVSSLSVNCADGNAVTLLVTMAATLDGGKIYVLRTDSTGYIELSADL